MKPRLLLSTSQDDPSPYVEAFLAAGGDPTARYCSEYSDSYDALVLCGGCDVHPRFYGEEVNGAVHMDPQRDEAEIRLIRAFREAGKPIFGICRGLQMLNVCFGGSLHQHLDAASTHSPQVFGNYLAHGAATTAASPCRGLYGERFPINSHHHQGIKTLAPGFKVTMESEDGVVEEILHETIPIWAVQWHPEKMCLRFARPDTVDGLPLIRRFVQLCK